jgi:hypothetical protein
LPGRRGGLRPEWTFSASHTWRGRTSWRRGGAGQSRISMPAKSPRPQRGGGWMQRYLTCAHAVIKVFSTTCMTEHAIEGDTNSLLFIPWPHLRINSTLGAHPSPAVQPDAGGVAVQWPEVAESDLRAMQGPMHPQCTQTEDGRAERVSCARGDGMATSASDGGVCDGHVGGGVDDQPSTTRGFAV